MARNLPLTEERRAAVRAGLRQERPVAAIASEVGVSPETVCRERMILNGGCRSTEIEPGRSVVNNWDRELFETWDQRKARRARERTEALHG